MRDEKPRQQWLSDGHGRQEGPWLSEATLERRCKWLGPRRFQSTLTRGRRAPVRSGGAPTQRLCPAPHSALAILKPRTLILKARPHAFVLLPIYFLIRGRLFFPLTRLLIITQPALLTQELRLLVFFNSLLRHNSHSIHKIPPLHVSSGF